MGYESDDPELVELRELIGPRRRQRIADTCGLVANNIRADDRSLHGQPVGLDNQHDLLILADLPVPTFRRDSLWRRRLARCADYLADDCETLGVPVPRSTGEEMVLHLVLRRAAAADTGTGIVAAGPDWYEQVPTGWLDLFEDLFQDHDVLALYEAPVSVVQRAIDTVNLDPNDWFDFIAPPLDLPPRTPRGRTNHGPT